MNREQGINPRFDDDREPSPAVPDSLTEAPAFAALEEPGARG
ncbi:hypothetical protein [Streptomyces sp. NPDC047706]